MERGEVAVQTVKLANLTSKVAVSQYQRAYAYGTYVIYVVTPNY